MLAGKDWKDFQSCFNLFYRKRMLMRRKLNVKRELSEFKPDLQSKCKAVVGIEKLKASIIPF
jgi:hypothetical protein